MDYTTLVPEAESTQSATLRLYDIFIPLLGVFIISLNLLVVISSGLLLQKRQQPRSTYLFLGNVGLSDLLTGVAVLFGHLYPSHLRCDLSCAIHMGMIVSSTLVSMLSVLLVAIDRFLYILYGLKYQRYIFPNRARILILTTWILGELLAVLVYRTQKPVFWQCHLGTFIGFLPAMIPLLRGGMTGAQCWFILMNREFILATTIIGIIPVFCVVVLYSFILYQALKKVSELKKATSGPNGTETANNLRYFRGSTANLNQFREQETTIPLRHQPETKSRFCCCWKSKPLSEENQTAAGSSSTDRQPSKWKAIKIVLFTTGSFVLTWVPYFIASTMYVYCDQENNPEFCYGLKIAIASPLAILGFANSLLNPIIYAWWHNGFRMNSIRIFSKKFKGVKCCRWCFNKSDENVASPRTTNLSSTPNLSSSLPQESSATSSTEINSNSIITMECNDFRDNHETN